MTNKEREVYASTWEMMKEMVCALSGDPYLYNLNKPGEEPGIGKENEENLHALIEHIDDHLQSRIRKKRKSIKSYCFHSGPCDGCDTDEEEKVCCYPGKECKCCDRGECKTCCYCT